MAINYDYDSDNKILLIKVIGEIKVEDYSNLMNIELPTNGIPIDTNAIWDLSDLDFSVVDLELEKKLNKVREQIDKKRQGTKIALVSDYDLGEPILKMFLIISQHLSQELRIIKTVEEAREWLSSK